MLALPLAPVSPTRFGLRLHETDARLLHGHMALDEDPPDIDTAEAALARATQLVTETGYHLRDVARPLRAAAIPVRCRGT